MALRFCDSFDHYVTADLPTKWTSQVSGPAISAGNGRRSTASMRVAGAVRTLTKTLDAQNTWIVGFAYKTSALPSVGTGCALVQLLDAGTLQCDLRLVSDGTLQVTRNATVLGTTSFVLSTGVVYFIEFKAVISDASGTAEVKVDGSSKLALTSQDTKNTANATANQILIGSGSGTLGGNQDFDDLYICDGTGSAPNNTFLGDVRVDALFPTGAGNTTELTRGGADSGANWSQVEETAPNSDTDYNEHATVGNKDDYSFGDIAHTPVAIFGVQILARAKKDDAGARSLATVTRSGGTDFDGATQALSTSYIYYSDIREVDPATSAAWTAANLNAANFGVKVAA